jgi:hypothetical protein
MIIIKLTGMAALAGVIAACTPTAIPPVFTEQEIATLCQAEGHQVGADTYEACLEEQRTLAFVQDIVRRHGGLSRFDRSYRTSR